MAVCGPQEGTAAWVSRVAAAATRQGDAELPPPPPFVPAATLRPSCPRSGPTSAAPLASFVRRGEEWLIWCRRCALARDRPSEASERQRRAATPDSVARDLQLEKSVGMRPVPSRVVVEWQTYTAWPPETRCCTLRACLLDPAACRPRAAERLQPCCRAWRLLAMAAVGSDELCTRADARCACGRAVTTWHESY